MRKLRCDSAAGAVRAAQAAALGPLDPPDHVHLRDGDRPFWDAIILARARDTWTFIDLTIAANLARSQADIEKLQADIDVEGYLSEKGRVNPKATVLETLSRRVVALARMVHVHAEATQGKSEQAGKALATEKKARDASTHDLIPTLRAVG